MAAWQVWALMSSAALTAICAKVGVEQVSPDVATLIGTAVIVVVLTTVTVTTRQLPALVTGAARAALARQTERRARGALRRRLPRREARADELARHPHDCGRRLVRGAEDLGSGGAGESRQGVQAALQR